MAFIYRRAEETGWKKYRVIHRGGVGSQYTVIVTPLN